MSFNSGGGGTTHVFPRNTSPSYLKAARIQCVFSGTGIYDLS
jgi:hypothetical protein